MAFITKYRLDSVTIILVAAFCALPWIIYQYPYPPGDDLLKQNWAKIHHSRYFGQIVLYVLPPLVFFYLVPLLTYIGLRLGKFTHKEALLTWLVLWLASSILLNQAWSSSVLPIVNTLVLGLLTIRLGQKWYILTIPGMILFHSVSGIIFAMALLTYDVWHTKASKKLILTLAVMGVLLLVIPLALQIKTPYQRLTGLTTGFNPTHEDFLTIYAYPPTFILFGIFYLATRHRILDQLTKQLLIMSLIVLVVGTILAVSLPNGMLGDRAWNLGFTLLIIGMTKHIANASVRYIIPTAILVVVTAIFLNIPGWLRMGQYTWHYY